MSSSAEEVSSSFIWGSLLISDIWIDQYSRQPWSAAALRRKCVAYSQQQWRMRLLTYRPFKFTRSITLTVTTEPSHRSSSSTYVYKGSTTKIVHSKHFSSYLVVTKKVNDNYTSNLNKFSMGPYTLTLLSDRMRQIFDLDTMTAQCLTFQFSFMCILRRF